MGNLHIIRKLALIQRKTLCGGNKDAVNAHFRSKYMTLDAAVNIIKQQLMDHDVLITHQSYMHEINPVIVRVTTTLTCVDSLEEIKCTIDMPVEKNNAQGMQSAITYAKRSNIANLFGLSEPDDDANASVEEEKKRGRPPGAKNKPKQSIAQQKRSDWPAFIDALRCADSDDEVEKIKTHALAMFPDMWAEPIMDLCQRTMLGEDIGEISEPQQ